MDKYEWLGLIGSIPAAGIRSTAAHRRPAEIWNASTEQWKMAKQDYFGWRLDFSISWYVKEQAFHKKQKARLWLSVPD